MEMEMEMRKENPLMYPSDKKLLKENANLHERIIANANNREIEAIFERVNLEYTGVSNFCLQTFNSRLHALYRYNYGFNIPIMIRCEIEAILITENLARLGNYTQEETLNMMGRGTQVPHSSLYMASDPGSLGGGWAFSKVSNFLERRGYDMFTFWCKTHNNPACILPK